MFSYESGEISKSSFFTEHLWWLLLNVKYNNDLRSGLRTTIGRKFRPKYYVEIMEFFFYIQLYDILNYV